MQKIKKGVLIIVPTFSPNIGGVETQYDDVYKALDKNGYKVTVLTYQPIITKARGLPLERTGNVTIYRFWWIGFDLFHKLNPYPVLQAFYLCPVLLLRSFIFLLKNSSDIDVIHTAGFNASLIGRVIKIIFKKRWVVSTHAIYGLKRYSFVAFMVKWILDAADKILTLSEPSRQELIKIGINNKKISNQSAWVDQDIFKLFDKQSCKEQIGYKDSFIALFVGRLLHPLLCWITLIIYSSEILKGIFTKQEMPREAWAQ